VVLVGADMLAELAETCPARRDRVHVVSQQPLPDSLFPLALAVGASSVVELPAAEVWLVETLTDAVDGASAPAVLVGVVGGCGGAGATTFATALALAAASDVLPVTLVDADPLGAGIETVAGLEGTQGAGWADLLESAGRLGSRSFRESLPRRGGLAVLGWGAGERAQLGSQVVRQVLSAALRGSALVVVDLPRRHDLDTTELLLRCDHLVVVTPLTMQAVAATGRLVSRLAPAVPRACLVARGPSSALDPGHVAEALGVPLAAAMTDQRRLSEWVSLGRGPTPTRRGPLARAARSTLVRVWSPDRALRT
jgi:secretion/DNA translocation related CpaE-like protein